MPDQLPFSETVTNAPPSEDRPGMVRLGKDFLHTGEFVIGFRDDGSQVKREFTEADLSAYAARFYELKAAGIPTPLRWGHGDGVSDTDDTQSEADVEDVWLYGGKLWFTIYVTPEDAAKLKKKQRPCSPGLEPNFTDGTGRTWPGYSLKHIAMVSHATVPDQLPFIQMGLPAPKPQGKKKMPMTFEVVKAGVDRMAQRINPESTLPEGVTEENFDEMFPMFVDLVAGKESEEEEAPEEEAPVLTEDAAPTDPLVMALKSGYDELLARVNALTAEKDASVEAEFAAKVDALCENGLPAKNKPILMGLGKKNGWDQSILEPYADAPALLLGSKTKHLKNAKEPGTAPFTEADRAKAQKLLGRNPK